MRTDVDRHVSTRGRNKARYEVSLRKIVKINLCHAIQPQKQDEKVSVSVFDIC